MKSIKIVITKRKLLFGLLGLLTLINTAGVVMIYLNQKTTSQYLFEVRNDYYGDTEYGEERRAQEFGYYEKGSENDDWTPNIVILSQEVKNLRASSGYNYETGTEEYKNQNIRVVKIEITNDTKGVYSYYDGQLGYTDENGRIIRTIMVHPDDYQNDKSSDMYSVELIPGGKATLNIYFTDYGSEITELKDYGYGV